MRNYLKEYTENLNKDLEKKKKYKEKEMQIVLEKIKFFQHERLIHLLVTLTFGVFALTFMVLGMLSYLFLIPFFILIVFMIFYIFHYFYLENGVQKLYRIYDQLNTIMQKEEKNV